METTEKTTTLPFFGIPKLKPYLKPYYKRIALSFFLLLVTSGASALPPVFNKYAIDRFVGNRTLDGLIPFTFLYLLTVMVQLLTHISCTYLNHLTHISLSRDLTRAAFSHLQTLSFSYFNKNNVGSIQSRLTSDIGNLTEAVCWATFAMLWEGIYILVSFTIMFFIDLKLATLFLVLVPIIAFIIYKFQNSRFRLGKEVRGINSTITGDFNEAIMGAKDIKLLVAEERMFDKFRSDTLSMKKKATHLGSISALSSSFVVFAGSLMVALVLIQGGHLTKEGSILIGTLSVFVAYATETATRIRYISGEIDYLIKSSANVARFDELMNEVSEVADSPEIIKKYGTAFQPKKENWEELLGDVEFKNVTFRYPDGDENVLENFNLKVPGGTSVAIVGETGAGKSTLVNLVCRFFEPNQGEILIDGRNAKERSSHWLHCNIGYVLQSPHLFSGSIRENLKYGNPDATDEDILKALKLVSAEDLIEKLEKGLDTEVGEGGDLLSTGEKQLLSFARAILSNPKILILDEATSSIDTVTEKRIQSAIHTVIRGRTSFVIAHRLSTVVDSDVILVVKDGKIIEKGKHKELLKQKGYYYSLYNRQFEEATLKNIL